MSIANKANSTTQNQASQIWVSGPPAGCNRNQGLQITQADLELYSTWGKLKKERELMRKKFIELYDLDAHIEKGKYSLIVEKTSRKFPTWVTIGEFLPQETVALLWRDIAPKLGRRLSVWP